MRLKVNEYYFHSMTGYYKLSLDTLESILKDGYIKSIKDIDSSVTATSGMHKPNEICLAEYTNAKVVDTQSAFSLFVATSPTLILDREIETFKPIITPGINFTDEELASGKYSNIYDEVRTTNAIATSHIKGVSFPVTELLNDNFKYLFYTDELIYHLTTSGIGGFLFSSIAASGDISSRFAKRSFLMKILKEIRMMLKYYDTRVPIYDFHQEDGEPVFELLKRR